MAGIYLHIPFCKRICAYCDFYKSARVALLPDIVRRMAEELEARKGYLKGEPVHTLYFGGGTPSLATPAQIGALVEQVVGLFDCSQLEEVTLEANPDDLTLPYLKGLRTAGINRLSIGVQSLHEEELRWMNRRHTALQARQAVEDARRAGFENLSLDFIYGVPGFGGATLEHNLRELIALGAEHLSAYHLTLEEGTLLGRKAARGEFQPVEEAQSEEEFLRVHQRLTEAGYEHYEVSNFAQPGRRSCHNSAYWQGVPYLGIGPAAHSFDGVSRRWSTDTVESYLQGGEFGFEEEQLSRHEALDERVMIRLRTSEGLSLRDFARDFGPEAEEQLLKRAAPHLEKGILKHEAGALRLKPEEFLISDWIIEQLMEEPS